MKISDIFQGKSLIESLESSDLSIHGLKTCITCKRYGANNHICSLYKVRLPIKKRQFIASDHLFPRQCLFRQALPICHYCHLPRVKKEAWVIVEEEPHPNSTLPRRSTWHPKCFHLYCAEELKQLEKLHQTRQWLSKIIASYLKEVDRYYYLEVWGFDPRQFHRFESGGIEYYSYYEDWMPLSNDLLLKDFEIGAIVNFNYLTISFDGANLRIGLRHRSDPAKIEYVECTHTIIAQSTLSQVLDGEDSVTFGREAQSPANLTPQEHFVALKSYVHAIADCGLGNLFEQASSNLFNFIGFNAEMQSQFLQCLNKLSPNSCMEIKRRISLQILENTPLSWFQAGRLYLLDSTYSFSEILASSEVHSTLDLELRQKFARIQNKVESV